MRYWHTIKRNWLAASFAEVPWPLRMARGIFFLLLVFGLIAAAVWIVFGRDAERQIVDVGEVVITMILIVAAPLLLFGLLAVPFHRWLMKRLITYTPDDRDHSK